MDPVSQFLNYVGQLTENLPGARAAMILLGGIVGAMLIKFLVRGLLHQTGLDERIARGLGLEDTNTEQAISQFIFLMLLLVVAIAALDAAGLSEVNLRLQTLTDPVIQAVPKLIFAGALCFLTWGLATLAKKIVQGILTASRVDARLGLDETRPLSRAILTILVSLIWLILLPLIINTLGIPEVSSFVNPFITEIWSFLPDLVFGSLVIAFGIFVANIVRKMVTAVLEGLRLDSVPASLGYEGPFTLLGLRPSAALGMIAMISVIVTMTSLGLRKMEILDLANLLSNLWAATLIFLIGLVLADLAKRAIGSKSDLFGSIAQYVVIFLFGGMALQRAQITALSSNVVEYLIRGAIVAAVIAFGVGGAIAIGLGGRDRVKRYLDSK